MPPQVPFIIGNEACERFSFYGMRNILTIFLIDWLLKNDVPAQAEREAAAKAAFHLFVFGVYFTPLLGGVRDPWHPDGDRHAGLLDGPRPVRESPAIGPRSAFVHGGDRQRLAQPAPGRPLPGSRPRRAPRRGRRGREGRLPRALHLRLHPLLLDALRPEGVHLGGAGAVDEPADRLLDVRAGADAAREPGAGDAAHPLHHRRRLPLP